MVGMRRFVWRPFLKGRRLFRRRSPMTRKSCRQIPTKCSASALRPRFSMTPRLISTRLELPKPINRIASSPMLGAIPYDAQRATRARQTASVST